MDRTDDVTLREHLQTRCDDLRANYTARMAELEKIVNAKFEWMEQAVAISSQQMDKRLEGMNEIRNSLRDQAAGFFTRSEHEVYQKGVDADLRLLREARAELAGKASQGATNLALILGLGGLILGLASFMVQIFKDFGNAVK
jgi:hypothetical protein